MTHASRPTPLSATQRRTGALRLLRRAQQFAGVAVAIDLALVGLFLWGVDPSNLGYSLSVLGGSAILVGVLGVALALPLITVGWVDRLQKAAAKNDWAAVRRGLIPATGLGYASWISPGFYLHEALRLLGTDAGPGTRPGPATPAH